jgi:hypothetical protein
LPYESFHKLYSEIIEMSKRQTRSSILSHIAEVVTGMDKLGLWFRGREGGSGMHSMGEQEHVEVVILENIKEMEKGFDAMIGFSGVKWQHLQRGQ